MRFALLSISLSLITTIAAFAAPPVHKPSPTAPADYLSQLGAAGSARWRPSHNPIKVYVAVDDKVEGYKPEFVPIVQQAFQEWSDALKGRIKFSFVPESEKPDMTVRFSSKRIELPCEGYTYVTPQPDGLIDTAAITLITLDRQQKPEDDESIHCIALHEIGHALGITGHSKGPKDIMRPHMDVTPGQHYTLSQSDKNTILRLYTADPFATTRPAALAKVGIRPAVEKHHRLNNEAVYAILHQQFPIAIEKLNQALEVDPHYSYALDNIQIAHFNWALAEIQKGNYAKSQELAEQAVAWAKKQNNSAAEHNAMDIVYRSKWNQTKDDSLIADARKYDPSIAKRMEQDKSYYEWQQKNQAGKK